MEKHLRQEATFFHLLVEKARHGEIIFQHGKQTRQIRHLVRLARRILRECRKVDALIARLSEQFPKKSILAKFV